MALTPIVAGWMGKDVKPEDGEEEAAAPGDEEAK